MLFGGGEIVLIGLVYLFIIWGLEGEVIIERFLFIGVLGLVYLLFEILVLKFICKLSGEIGGFEVGFGEGVDVDNSGVFGFVYIILGIDCLIFRVGVIGGLIVKKYNIL